MSKRQDLIDTAIRLFSKYGYHGTGIDRIAQEAKVSKKTMYHHFRTKDELIQAALKHHDSVFRNEFMRAVKKRGGSAEQQLLSMFDVAHEWFIDPKFFGCMYINAIGEYSDSDSAIRGICKEFKRQMRGYIEQLVEQIGVHSPKETAESISLLFEGAIVTAQVFENPSAAITAKDTTRIIIEKTKQS